MTKPAEPEREDTQTGKSNPGQSLWDAKKPYIGPPEEGQPHLGNASKAPPTAPAITGDPEP